MEYIKIEALANIAMQKLNEISDTLFNSGLIKDNVHFSIVDNFKLIKGASWLDDDPNFTPGTMALISDPPSSNFFSGIYRQAYIINFKGYFKERDSLEGILNHYAITENQYPFDELSGWHINKYVGNPRFNAVINTEDGKAHLGKRVHYWMQLDYSFTLGGVNSKSIKLELDDTQMEFTQIVDSNDKSLLPNIAYGDGNISQLDVFERFTILTPIQVNNAKNIELLRESIDQSFNKNHQLKITFIPIEGSEVILEREVVMRKGQINILNQDMPAEFQMTFMVATPRIEYKIDGEVVPVVKYTDQTVINTEPALVDEALTEDETLIVGKSVPTNISTTMTLVIMLERDNQKCMELLQAHRDKSLFNKSFILSEKMDFEDTPMIRHAIVTNSVYSNQEENANLLELTLVETVIDGTEVIE